MDEESRPALAITAPCGFQGRRVSGDFDRSVAASRLASLGAISGGSESLQVAKGSLMKRLTTMGSRRLYFERTSLPASADESWSGSAFLGVPCEVAARQKLAEVARRLDGLAIQTADLWLRHGVDEQFGRFASPVILNTSSAYGRHFSGSKQARATTNSVSGIGGCFPTEAWVHGAITRPSFGRPRTTTSGRWCSWPIGSRSPSLNEGDAPALISVLAAALSPGCLQKARPGSLRSVRLDRSIHIDRLRAARCLRSGDN